MGTKIKLMPCPFCGGKARMISGQVDCSKCEASGPLNGPDRAALWNKRAGELQVYDIQFELVFTRGKMKDSAANGTYYRQTVRAATMKEAEKIAKTQLKARLEAEGMPTPFKLEWIGSSLVR